VFESINKGKARTLAVSAIVRFENTTLLHASMLVDNTSQLYDMQKDYAADLAKEVIQLVNETDAAVDEHHTDQLLIYMALASGMSQMRVVKPISLHTKTMLALLRMYREDLVINCHKGDKSVLI